MKTLQSDLQHIKIQNGNMAVQSDVLVLRLQELKKLFPDQANIIRQMGIKINKARQLSSTIYHTEKNIETILQDSVIYDTVQVKVLNYSDQWYDIKGIAVGNSQQLSIKSSDTLVQVVFKGQRVKPWLWIFSPRKLQQRVSVSNPSSIIRYSELIQIQKQ